MSKLHPTCFRIIMGCALIVFVADKIFNKLVCCSLCQGLGDNLNNSEDEEQMQLHNHHLDSPSAAIV